MVGESIENLYCDFVDNILSCRVVYFLGDEFVHMLFDLCFGIGLSLSDGICKCGVDSALDGFIFGFEVSFEFGGFVFVPPCFYFGLGQLGVCINVLDHKIFCLDHDFVSFCFDGCDGVFGDVLGGLLDGISNALTELCFIMGGLMCFDLLDVVLYCF